MNMLLPLLVMFYLALPSTTVVDACFPLPPPDTPNGQRLPTWMQDVNHSKQQLVHGAAFLDEALKQNPIVYLELRSANSHMIATLKHFRQTLVGSGPGYDSLIAEIDNLIYNMGELKENLDAKQSQMGTIPIDDELDNEIQKLRKNFNRLAGQPITPTQMTGIAKGINGNVVEINDIIDKITTTSTASSTSTGTPPMVCDGSSIRNVSSHFWPLTAGQTGFISCATGYAVQTALELYSPTASVTIRCTTNGTISPPIACVKYCPVSQVEQAGKLPYFSTQSAGRLPANMTTGARDFVANNVYCATSGSAVKAVCQDGVWQAVNIGGTPIPDLVGSGTCF